MNEQWGNREKIHIFLKLLFLHHKKRVLSRGHNVGIAGI